jgi:uncharacterized BrkB/YihY/UPF0761 family membrane protein
MNVVEQTFRRFDQFQQRHPVLAIPLAVVQKYGNDQAGGKAVLIAYYGLFALFPLCFPARWATSPSSARNCRATRMH